MIKPQTNSQSLLLTFLPQWSVLCLLFILSISLLSLTLTAAEALKSPQTEKIDNTLISLQKLASLLDTDAEINGDFDQYFKNCIDLALDPTLTTSVRVVALRLANTISLDDMRQEFPGLTELQTILADQTTSPELQTQASAMLEQLYMRSGEAQKARQLASDNGAIPEWLISAPWGRVGFTDAFFPFAPETNPKIWEEGTESPAWQKADSAALLPTIDAWSQLENNQGLAYLITSFKLNVPDQDTLTVDNDEIIAKLRLIINFPGYYSVFLNGRVVVTNDSWSVTSQVENNLFLDCRAGWNTLLIKVKAGTAGEQALFVRLQDIETGAAANLQYSLDQENFYWPSPVTTTSSVSEDGDEAYLLQKHRVDYSSKNIQAKLESILPGVTETPEPLRAACQAIVSTIWLKNHREDDALAALESAAAVLGDSPGVWLRLAQARVIQQRWPDARRINLAREACREALKYHDNHIGALLDLATIDTAIGNTREALDTYSRIIDFQPNCLPALLMRARIGLEKLGASDAKPWIDTILSNKLSPGGYRLLFELGEKENDWEKQEFGLLGLLKSNQASPSLRIFAARILQRRGNSERAIILLREGIEKYAHQAIFYQALGELLQRQEQLDAATDVFTQAVELFPRRHALFRSLGDCEQLAGRIDLALTHYQQSLTLKPSQHDLRQIIAELKGEDATFWTPHIIDPFKALEEELKRGQRFAGSTVRVIDQTVLEVYPDGSYANYTHSLQKVLNDNGIERSRELYRIGETIQARTILPDLKTTAEPVGIPGQNTFTLPALAPGAAAEHIYLETSRQPENRRLQFPKWYFRSPESQEDFLLSQYIVRVAKGTPFNFAAKNFGNLVKYEKSSSDDYTVHIWTAKDVPQARREASTPNIDEYLPYVQLSGDESWDDINRALMNRYLTSVKPSRDIAVTAQSVIGDAAHPREIAQRLHSFVVKEIIASPNSDVVRTLYSRAGKREYLLFALLDSLGLNPVLASVRANSSVMFEPCWELPSADYFPLQIVGIRVDNSWLWMDCRFPSLRPGELLEDVAGGVAFLLGKQYGEFLTLPQDRGSFINNYSLQMELPATSHSFAIEGTQLMRGIRAHEILRERNADLNRRVINLENRFVRSLPGMTNVQHEFDHTPDQVELPPLREYFSAEIDLIEVRGNALAAPIVLPPLPLLPEDEGVAGSAARSSPYHLPLPLRGRDIITYILPEEAKLIRLPTEKTLKEQFGQYTLRVTKDNISNNQIKVTVRRSYHFPAQRIQPEQFADFSAMVETITTAEQALLEYTRGEMGFTTYSGQ